MKTIQSVPIWNNGKTEEAVILSAYVISDNLKDSAIFYYAMLNSEKAQLAQGNVTMAGKDYEGYSSNNDAWSWISTVLGITITGDFIENFDTLNLEAGPIKSDTLDKTSEKQADQ